MSNTPKKNELYLELIDILFRHRISPVSKGKVYFQCEVCETKMDDEIYAELDHEMQILIDRQEPILRAIQAYISKEYVKRKDVAIQETKARIDQVHKDLGGLPLTMPMRSMRNRNTAFKRYAVKFFNDKIKQRREAQLATLNSNLKGQED